MVTKVYAIIHDGKNVLVGFGGQSGRNPRTRQGYHFSGGTANSNDLKREVLKEIAEETGFDLSTFPISAPYRVERVEGMEDVWFCVIKVLSVPGLVAQFKRPKGGNRHDEPFDDVLALSFEQALTSDQFRSEYNTNWFLTGLHVAYGEGKLS